MCRIRTIVKEKSSVKTLFSVMSAVSIMLINANCILDTVNNPSDEDTVTESKVWSCVIPAGEEPEYARAIGCSDDFSALASEPLDASIPGAISGKTVIDLEDPTIPLYFQNSKKYQVHYEFAEANLNRSDLPPVRSLSNFNQVEYYSKNRRFILGAITYYEGPKVWTYEIAPYDNASVEMIKLNVEDTA